MANLRRSSEPTGKPMKYHVGTGHARGPYPQSAPVTPAAPRAMASAHSAEITP